MTAQIDDEVRRRKDTRSALKLNDATRERHSGMQRRGQRPSAQSHGLGSGSSHHDVLSASERRLNRLFGLQTVRVSVDCDLMYGADDTTNSVECVVSSASLELFEVLDVSDKSIGRSRLAQVDAGQKMIS